MHCPIIGGTNCTVALMKFSAHPIYGNVAVTLSTSTTELFKFPGSVFKAFAMRENVAQPWQRRQKLPHQQQQQQQSQRASDDIWRSPQPRADTSIRRHQAVQTREWTLQSITPRRRRLRHHHLHVLHDNNVLRWVIVFILRTVTKIVIITRITSAEDFMFLLGLGVLCLLAG